MMENQNKAMSGKVIPPGYKLTEVGVIPEDWLLQKLGLHASFRTGPFGSALHKSDYVDGGIPVVNPMQIVDGKVVPTFSMAISGDAAKKLAEFRLSVGDVVIGRRGDMGRCAVITEKENGWLCGTGSMIIRVKPSCDAAFLQRILSSASVISAIENTSVGTTMINLNQGTLRELQIVLPKNKNEQTAIANALSDTDELIATLEHLIAKKKSIKTATMQQLLTGRTRLSQFSKHSDGTPKGFTSSELGLIPEDWILSPMSQMGHVLRGVSYNGSRDLFPHDTDDSVRLFRSNNIYNSKIDLANLQYVNKNRVAFHQLMNRGDILICMANGSKNLVGKAAIYNIEESHKYTFGAFMGVFRTFPEVESLYAFYLLTSDRCRNYIDLALAGSSINNLKPSDIEQFTFALPNSEEQKAIVAILSDMDAELEVLEQKLSKVRGIKQGMMQQLLTGRIRLPLDHQL